MEDWQDLNERQRGYLLAIYESDQEADRIEHWRYLHGYDPRPASTWRWLRYSTPAGRHAQPKRRRHIGMIASQPSPLQPRLHTRGLVDAGTGATLRALAARGYIELRSRTGAPDPDVQMTPLGRKLVRAATSVSPAPAPLLAVAVLEQAS